MKKLAILAVAMILATIPGVMAGVGGIRIETPDGEYWPVMVESPAEFNIWVQGTSPANDPHILLVMTEDCFNASTGPVNVSWTGGSVSFETGDFTPVSGMGGVLVPPSGADPAYQVSALKDHLDYGLSDPLVFDDTIYWAMDSFLGAPIPADKENPLTFNVTLPSDEPRMLVYALGKSSQTDNFDMRVPPTRPGFIVPELAPVVLALGSFSALALFAIRRRKVMRLK